MKEGDGSKERVAKTDENPYPNVGIRKVGAVRELVKTNVNPLAPTSEWNGSHRGRETMRVVKTNKSPQS